MRKLTLVLLLAITFITGVAYAQAPSRTFWAADFNKWSLQGQGSIYTFNAATSCITNPYNSSSYTFNTNAPVYISDFGTPTNSEIVTPSTVTSASGTCGFTASTSHTHPNFQVQSGTAGLQEILNYLSKTATNAATVVIDQNFYGQAVAIGSTASTLISAASGGTGIVLVDTTTSPWTWYAWSGSAYVASSAPVANFSNAGNGSSWKYFVNTELVTLATGAQTTDTVGNVLPANSVIDMVQGVVNTTITSACTGWELGDASTAARFSTNDTTLTAGEAVPKASFAPAQLGTGVASATTGVYQAAAAKLRITCAGGNPGAGKVRIVVYGRTFANPTS